MKILLTSTSFMDTPGPHHDKLSELGFEVDRMRGPLSDNDLLPVISQYDGMICGDDELNEKVLTVGVQGNLKFLSKYGIGLDKIDLKVADKLGILIANTPGVNHVTVAEHTFTHILAFYRNYFLEISNTKTGKWTRMTGHEIYGKTLAIFGLGRIGREVAIRAKAFGLRVKVYDPYPDMNFIRSNELIYVEIPGDLFKDADIITLHSPLTPDSRHVINEEVLKSLTEQPLIVNTARADLVDKTALIHALDDHLIAGYVTDVMWSEPMDSSELLLKYDNVFITPHIGSRTFESVSRQGCAAVDNLKRLFLNLDKKSI